MVVHKKLQNYIKLYYINGGTLEIINILHQWWYTGKYNYTKSMGLHRKLQDYKKLY